MLLPEHLGERQRNKKLESQAGPEPGLRQSGPDSLAKVREGDGRDQTVGAGGTGEHGKGRTEHLSTHQDGEDVSAGQGGEQHHAETHTLDVVEQAEPQPQAARDDGARDGVADPGDVHAHARNAPQHLGPAGGAEADGEHGEEPGVLVGEAAEGVEDDGPQTQEEEDGEEDDAPPGDELRREEEGPVAAVRCRQPVVLDDDHGEEARDDLAAGQRDVEAGDGVGRLAVEVGEAKVYDDADGPEDDADGDADDDCAGKRAGTDEARDGVRAVGHQSTPVPEAEGVDLCETGDDQGTSDPLSGRGTTFVTKVESESDGTVAGSCGVKGGGGVLERTPDAPVGDVGGDTQAEEGEAEEEPGDGKGIDALEVARHEEPYDRGAAVCSCCRVELGGFLRCLASEKDDLVRVDGDDLAENEEQGVDGPVADAAGEEPEDLIC